MKNLQAQFCISSNQGTDNNYQRQDQSSLTSTSLEKQLIEIHRGKYSANSAMSHIGSKAN